MPEQVIETEVKTENKPVEQKITSVGKPERVNLNFGNKENNSESVLENKSTPSDNQPKPDITKTTTAQTSPQAEELTEDQIKAFFEKKGIAYEGIDKLKEKIEYKPEVPLTDEQKAEQSKAKEKLLLDAFIKGGGTAEQYVGIKAIAEMDVAELSKNALKKELKEAGFNDEKIEEIIKNRYYQFDDEEIEQEEDESDKDFKKRSKEFFANKLANRSLHTKTQAQKILSDLNTALESENLLRQEEVATSAKIDDYFKSIPRKLSFEIGEIEGKALPPVEYDISDSDIAEVQSLLKDSDKRNNFLYNQDGSLNHTNIADVMLRNKYLESALKAAYHQGGSRQVEEFRKVFPAETAHQIGIGGSTTNKNGNGNIASYGKVQKVSRPQHN